MIDLQKPSAAAIRTARNAAEHTQTEAGVLVGATLRTWQDWEGGQRPMPPGLFALYQLLSGQHPDFELRRRAE